MLASSIPTVYRRLPCPEAAWDDVFCRIREFLILFLTSLLTVPLARQRCFDAALLTGLQVVGVTLYFLNDVLLLYLALEPAQRILERLAFLNANLSQTNPPPNLPGRLSIIILEFSGKLQRRLGITLGFDT
jgi:hypothetical protein